MSSRGPPNWTFAARAAYFGERMCAFCDHRNPAGAKFCNDCGSPLDLKPCKRCDAVNDQAATNCYNCGAACAESLSMTEPTRSLPDVDSAPAQATPADSAVATTVAQPLFAAPAARAGWRLLSPGQFLLAAIATSVIVAAYDAYRVNVAAPNAMAVAPQPVAAPANDALAATAALPLTVESKPVDAEGAAALRAPIPDTNAEVTNRESASQPPLPAPVAKRASARQQQAPVPVTRAGAHHKDVPGPATKRASGHQSPVSDRPALAGASPSAAHSLAAARGGVRVAQTSKALQQDAGQMMKVSLARCNGGDLIDRIVCEQRARRNFCEGRVGALECMHGFVNEHGQ